MAVTVTGTPQLYTPAYNENVFVATSTQVAQPNFRFKCEVLDASSTVIATVEVFPDSDNNMVFDAHRIIENYMTSNPTLTNITGVATCPASYKKYKLRVTERYGAPLADGATATTSFIYAFNASFSWLDFATYDYTDYAVNIGAVIKFQTNSPASQNIHPNEKAYLHFIQEDPFTSTSIRVRTYNSSNVLLQEFIFFNINQPISNDDMRFCRFPSAWNLNNIAAPIIATGSQPVIHSGVAYWIIDLTDLDTGTPVPVSEEKTFVAVPECTIYTSFRVHFLNSLGGFDSFTFNRRSDISTKITRKTFEPVYGSVSSGVWGYNIREQRKKDFYIEGEPVLKLNSDWITTDESSWLGDLVSSPEIYVEAGNDGNFFSAHIKTSDYTPRNHASEKIFNLDIELDLGKNIRQRW